MPVEFLVLGSPDQCFVRAAGNRCQARPAAGVLFRRACLHEHIRDVYMCLEHAQGIDSFICFPCFEKTGKLVPIRFIEKVEVP